MNGTEQKSLDYYFGLLEGKVDAIARSLTDHLADHKAGGGYRAAIQASVIGALVGSGSWVLLDRMVHLH